MRKVFSRVMWLARGTSAMLGLVVMLAVVLGVGTTALAAVPGDPLKLGQSNVVNAITRLAGNADGGAVLALDNNSNAAGSRALDLRTEPGRAPVTVNADAGKAINLNADKLDGKDSTQFLGKNEKAADAETLDGQDASAFMPASTYRVDREITVDFVFSTAVLCDSGDLALSGAWANKDAGTEIVTATPGRTDSQSVGFLIDSDSPLLDDMTLIAVCADLPPLR